MARTLSLSDLIVRSSFRDPSPYEQEPHDFLAAFLASAGSNDPVLHTQHVIPGAKRAITHAELRAWQAQGLGEVEICARINERWETVSQHRREAFLRWLPGHREIVERHRERESQRHAALAELERRLIEEAK